MKKATCDLKSCFLCSHCKKEWKELVSIKKQTIYLKKGSVIFREGDEVKGIYFVYTGGAKIHKQWIEQKELIIRFAAAGDIMGHRGFGASEVYPISATTLTDTKVCFIGSEFLEATLRTDADFVYKLMQFYAEELSKAELRMRDLSLLDVRKRIALALLEIRKVFGTDKKKYIDLPITRQDIAAYAGTTYETVFKFLKILTSSRIISVSGKSIRINDDNKLHKIIEGPD